MSISTERFAWRKIRVKLPISHLTNSHLEFVTDKIILQAKLLIDIILWQQYMKEIYVCLHVSLDELDAGGVLVLPPQPSRYHTNPAHYSGNDC